MTTYDSTTSSIIDRFLVQEVLARYARAADHRDAAAMAALFVPDARVEVFFNDAGTPRPVAQLDGAEAIGQAVVGMMVAHPPLGWSHHTTHDHLVEVDGDEARLDAQFVVFETIGRPRPDGGWPAGAVGAQATVRPIESGYYRPVMLRTPEGWRIRHHTIVLDQPMAFPS
jgi:hypothetical protein